MTSNPIASAAKESRDRFLALVSELRPELHRYCARMTGSIIDGEDIVQDTLARAYFALPEDALARDEAVRASVSRFLELPPLQRSCAILKDFLEHSADEIASLLALSVPAVRAALHRGRA